MSKKNREIERKCLHARLCEAEEIRRFRPLTCHEDSNLRQLLRTTESLLKEKTSSGYSAAPTLRLIVSENII